MNKFKKFPKESQILSPLLINAIGKALIFLQTLILKVFEGNNKSIALNIFYVPYNTKELRPAYVSKHNLKRKNEVFLLMITDGEKDHYLAVKSLSALLRGIT